MDEADIRQEDKELLQFMFWLSIHCPILYQKQINLVYYSTREQVRYLFADLKKNGFMWCMNWELTALGFPSLN